MPVFGNRLRSAAQSKEFWAFQLFPFIFIISALIEIATAARPDTFQKIVIRFLTSIVFLDITHNAFSVAMFWIPGVRRALARAVYFKAIAVFALTTLAFIFALNVVQASGIRNTGFIHALFIGYLFLVTHHDVSQKRGFSFLMSRWTGEGNDRSDLERWEKRASMTIIGTFVGAQAYVYFSNLRMVGFSHTIFMAITFLIALLIVGWLFTMLRYRTAGPAKFLYGLRMLSYPLALHTFWGSAAIGSIHGLEHLFILRRMYKGSESGAWRSRFLWVLALSTLIVVGIGILRIRPLISNLFDGIWHEGLGKNFAYYVDYPLLNLLVAISMGGTITHYYLDRKMFQMRNPLVRKFVGPLLR